MTKKVKDVVALLETHGWVCVRMRGDHRVFVKQGARRPIVVPGNMNADLAAGTLKSILRESGLSLG